VPAGFDNVVTLAGIKSGVCRKITPASTGAADATSTHLDDFAQCDKDV
jgi:hypothetical protein